MIPPMALFILRHVLITVAFCAGQLLARAVGVIVYDWINARWPNNPIRRSHIAIINRWHRFRWWLAKPAAA